MSFSNVFDRNVLSVAPWAYQPSQSCDSQGYWKSMFLEFRCSFRLNSI